MAIKPRWIGSADGSPPVERYYTLSTSTAMTEGYFIYLNSGVPTECSTNTTTILGIAAPSRTGSAVVVSGAPGDPVGLDNLGAGYMDGLGPTAAAYRQMVTVVRPVDYIEIDCKSGQDPKIGDEVDIDLNAPDWTIDAVSGGAGTGGAYVIDRPISGAAGRAVIKIKATVCQGA